MTSRAAQPGRRTAFVARCRLADASLSRPRSPHASLPAANRPHLPLLPYEPSPRHRRLLAQPALGARLLGRARQVAGNRRHALRAQRPQAVPARVQHEDRHAGRGRRAARLGLHYETRLLRPGAISGTSTAISGRRLRRSEHRRWDGCRSRVRRLGGAAEGARRRTIGGRIIGDDNAFDERRSGSGGRGTTCRTTTPPASSALQFNENTVRVDGRARPAVGDSRGVGFRPPAAAWRSTTR